MFLAYYLTLNTTLVTDKLDNVFLYTTQAPVEV